MFCYCGVVSFIFLVYGYGELIGFFLVWYGVYCFGFIGEFVYVKCYVICVFVIWLCVVCVDC